MELVKPDCLNPQLMINVSVIKMIDDGVCRYDFPRPDGSAYSSHYYALLWSLYEKGWDLEVEYKGMTFDVFYYVPCYHCVLCKQARKNDIVRRAEYASMAYACPPYTFVLSYDDEHLPQYGELCYRDFQLFNKRFRQLMKSYGYPTDYKWIVAGEYGSKFGRPHMHVVLFNNPFRCSEFQPLLESDLKWFVWRAWSNDKWQVFSLPNNFRQCYGGIASYISKYIGKRSKYEDRFIPQAGRKVHPCFVRCSNGLVSDFVSQYDDYYSKVHTTDFEFFDPNRGMSVSQHMSRSLVSRFHPSPLAQVPVQVKDALKSLVDAGLHLRELGYISLKRLLTLVRNVKINVQHMPFIKLDELGSYQYCGCSTSRKLLVNKCLTVFNNSIDILRDYGMVDESVIDDYLRFRDSIIVSVRDGLASAVYRAEKSLSTILHKSKL